MSCNLKFLSGHFEYVSVYLGLVKSKCWDARLKFLGWSRKGSEEEVGWLVRVGGRGGRGGIYSKDLWVGWVDSRWLELSGISVTTVVTGDHSV